jgi:hypothetical protein
VYLYVPVPTLCRSVDLSSCSLSPLSSSPHSRCIICRTEACRLPEPKLACRIAWPLVASGLLVDCYWRGSEKALQSFSRTSHTQSAHECTNNAEDRVTGNLHVEIIVELCENAFELIQPLLKIGDDQRITGHSQSVRSRGGVFRNWRCSTE